MKSQAQVDIAGLLQGVIQRLLGKYDKPQHPAATTPTVVPAISSGFGSAVLSAAKADLGVREDLGRNDGKRIREYFKNFGMSGGQDWCAAAVSTWMKEAGGGPIKGGVGARNVGEQFKQAGLWVSRDQITPKDMTPGNIVVWARGGPDSWKGHIGVISSFDGKSGFISIEANSGPRSDAVVTNSHSIKDSNLLGVGILSDHKPAAKIASLDRIEKLAAEYERITKKLLI